MQKQLIFEFFGLWLIQQQWSKPFCCNVFPGTLPWQKRTISQHLKKKRILVTSIAKNLVVQCPELEGRDISSQENKKWPRDQEHSQRFETGCSVQQTEYIWQNFKTWKRIFKNCKQPILADTSAVHTLAQQVPIFPLYIYICFILLEKY